jgi:hypothetical protein
MAAFLLWPLAALEFGTHALDYLARTLTKETTTR